MAYDLEKLASYIKSLHLSSTLSDIEIKCRESNFPAHRLVLYCFGSNWGDVVEEKNTRILDWSHLDKVVAMAILNWVYTGKLPGTLEESSLLALMAAAGDFQLPNLVKLSEERLGDLTTLDNCLEMYAVAAGAKALILLDKAGKIIADNWHHFTKDHFKNLEPSLVCDLFINIHSDPLHRVVILGRQDVLDFFVKNRKTLVLQWVNAKNKDGYFPLELALTSKQWELAKILIAFNANVNALNSRGWNYLQSAIAEQDQETALFLLNYNADIFNVTPVDEDSCLHLVVSSVRDSEPLETIKEFQTAVCKVLLEKGADPNRSNSKGLTPLHFALKEGAIEVVDLLLQHKNIDLNITTNDGYHPIKFALENKNNWQELANKLISAGAKIDIVCTDNRQSLLQTIIESDLQQQALYLCERVPKAHLNHMNTSGETALHLAAVRGMVGVVASLLEAGANPNIETVAPTSRATTFEFGSNVAYMGYKQTCLHYAILHGQISVLEVLLDKQSSLSEKLDCNLKDSVGNTPLSLAFMNPQCVQLVPKLITCGADVNLRNAAGLTLLHKAILDGDSSTTLFLLNHGADINARTKNEGKHPLHMAIENRLGEVVDAICKRGVDMSVENEEGNCALWAALTTDQYDIASILVRNGADTDAWGPGPDGCYQTLLHAAIDDNLQDVANFLIKSGCDINTPQRSSPEAGGNESVNGWTPLHLCCQWGLDNVVQTLLVHGAAINKQDADGKTPLHLAIENQQEKIIDILLCHPSIDVFERDNRGLSPFAAAVSGKYNKAASAILDKFPNAAEQFNKKGLNLLHMTLESNQLESVLFLLAINVNVNSITRDASRTPPLHLAAAGGNEVIVRSLILAGAKVNAVDGFRQTALHVAAAKGHAVVISALISHEGSPDLTDGDGNNALHVACIEGHSAAARVLLMESSVNAEALNTRGLNPLHVLARYGKENAHVICDLISETMPDYPLDCPDAVGNTALLIAYMKGNGNLCRSLVKAGACLGAMNQDGVTIFNYHVATKQLLYSLLESLDKEPRWSEGDTCLECGIKFSLTMRRHHCRHCGRLLCSRCSDQDMAILKYKLNKPVRVCAMCFFVLQGGAA